MSELGTSKSTDDTISVLIVDDDPAVLSSWREILSDDLYHVTLMSDPVEADQRIGTMDVDVAVVDIRMPAMDGMELLSRLKAKRKEIEVVMMTGFGGVQDAVEAIKRGAYDFLSKPFESMEAAELTVRRAAELHRLERRVMQLEEQMEGKSVKMIGQSPAIRQVHELVRSIAASPATVLIVGESGTGKDLLARSIHESSPRAKKEMVTLNCSALPEALLESELFGHTKGAFTGATSNHQGLFKAADGGTIFLDEIGDMALPTQAKLLRTLQEGEVRPVGSSQAFNVDVRVIAATNADFEQKLADKSFREDLYYRLNVIRIEMPPLRERGDDIALLAHHFLGKHQKAIGREFAGIDPSALERMQRFRWRGNVRELENVIERAVAVSRTESITLADLPPRVVGDSDPAATLDPTSRPFNEAKSVAVERFERDYLLRLLQQHDSISAAARTAGLDRSNFRRLLRKHGIQQPKNGKK